MADSPASKKVSITDLEQRVEDLEDLVMVENAGIEELKSLMQSINAGMGTKAQGEEQHAEIPHDLAEKIALFDEIRKAVNDLEVKSEDLEKSVDMIKSGGVDLGGGTDLKPLENRMAGLESKIEAVRKEGTGGLVSRMEAIEKVSNTLSDQMDRMQRDYKDSTSMKRGMSSNESRIDAIEKVMKNVSEDVEKIRLEFKKFDSFDRMSGMVKNLDKKIDELKIIESEVRRVSGKVEGFYQNLDKRLDKMNEFERVFPEMRQQLQMLREEAMKKIDENKVLVIDKASKDETSSLRDRLSQLERKAARSEQEIGKLKDDASVPDDPMSVVRVELSDIMSRIVAIETRIGNVENIMQRRERAPIVLE